MLTVSDDLGYAIDFGKLKESYKNDNLAKVCIKIINNEELCTGDKLYIPVNRDKIKLDSQGIIKLDGKCYITEKMTDEAIEYLYKHHRAASSICGPRKILSWPECQYPRQRFHADHFYICNRIILLMVDSYSNYLMLHHLKSYNVDHLFEAMTSIFACHGKPDCIIFDNQP
uniref:Integrase catalytic domain-containing protein n=1 Tax=Strongyloides papillosus TaxID=174720 RepID=A0A0N5C5T0_STREA